MGIADRLLVEFGVDLRDSVRQLRQRRKRRWGPRRKRVGSRLRPAGPS